MIEPLGDAMDHRILEAIVMEHRRIDEGRQLGFAVDDVLRLAPDPIPDRIERGKLRTLRIDLMYCHGFSLGLLSQIVPDIIARWADGRPGQALAS